MAQVVKLKNVDISIFNNLLLQSLEVTQQLMFEFSPEFLKSANFSSSKTLIKLWSIKISDLIKLDEVQEIEALDDTDKVLNLNNEQVTKESLTKDFDKTFNFYVLNGNSFKNYLSVFKNDIVDIDFKIDMGEDNKLQAKSIIIYGKTENDRTLNAEFTLTTDDLITDKISDYNQLLTMCKPKDGMTELTLSNNHIKELRKLISNLNKTLVNNSAFVTLDINENKIKISDKVFNLEFDDIEIKNLKENLNFNILKSDFNLIGNHSFKIYTDENHVIHFGAKYGNAIIWCMTSKPQDSIQSLEDDDDLDNLSSSDLTEYDLDEF